ncbi:MAG: dienelactone hydrolase family protein [Betaproteobacteria bacterium]|nr:dienelactone hydrolase family protein [Betaproteobacteria bacterium]
MNDRATFDDPHLESLLPKVAFSRRGFLASAAASGFALAAGPVMAQTAIKTPLTGLEDFELRIPVFNGNMPAYIAAPKKANKLSAIIVVPEVFGMHEYQKDICRRLANAGYVGVTFDPFFRRGDLSRMTDIKQVVGLANSLDDFQALGDMDALVDFLGTQKRVNPKKIGITGMCRGGRTVWMYAAHSKKIRAGVSWYGPFSTTPPAMPRSPIDVADDLNVPVLGLYGGADDGIPLDMVERMRAALVAFGKDKESMIHVYEGMPHAFHADYRPSYRKEAAEDGWKRMLAWFKKHGV